MRKYYVIKENYGVKALLSIIRENYKFEDKDFLIKEINLNHLLNNIKDDDIKILVKKMWKSLEIILGCELRLLEKYKRRTIDKIFRKDNRDISLIIKFGCEKLFEVSGVNVQMKTMKI